MDAAHKSVIAPHDVWEEYDAGRVLRYRAGDRMTPEDAIKFKIVPIESEALPQIETK